MASLFLHLAQRALGSAIVPRPVLAPVLPAAPPMEQTIAERAPVAEPQGELPRDPTPAKVVEPGDTRENHSAPSPRVNPREPVSPRAQGADTPTAPLPPATGRPEPALSRPADRVVATVARAPLDAEPPVVRSKREETSDTAQVPRAMPRERAALAAAARELRPAPREPQRRETADSTVIEVSIGRIDVHQPVPPRAPAPTPAPASRRISLGDYLGGKRRN